MTALVVPEVAVVEECEEYYRGQKIEAMKYESYSA
jgi:hypothetical protein